LSLPAGVVGGKNSKLTGTAWETVLMTTSFVNNGSETDQ